MRPSEHVRSVLAASLVLMITIHRSEETSKGFKDNNEGDFERDWCGKVFQLKEFQKLSDAFCKSKKRTSTKRHAYTTCMHSSNRKFDLSCLKCQRSAGRCKSLKSLRANLLTISGRMFRDGKTPMRVCDVQTYDPRRHLCCHGPDVRHQIPSSANSANVTCCGSKVFDIRHYICCNGSAALLDRIQRASAACCGHSPYDMEVEFCFKDKIYPKNEEVADVMHSVNDRSSNYEENLSPQIVEHANVFEKHTDVFVLSGSILVIGVGVLTVGVVIRRRRVRAFKPPSDAVEGIFTISLNDTRRDLCPKLEESIQEPTDKKDAQNIYLEVATIESEGAQTANILDSVTRADSSLQGSDCETDYHSTSCELGPHRNLSSAVDANMQTFICKPINIKDFMGRTFCKEHVFTKNNLTLQLEHSSVTLTLSEKDVEHESVRCFASTFRYIPEICDRLEKEGVLHKDEMIASPTIEYLFPDIQRLAEFGCVKMDHKGQGMPAFRVCKTEVMSDGSLKPVVVKHKDDVDLNDPELDAYYEEECPGRVRIFLRSFCVVYCTFCPKNDHTDQRLKLDAYLYTKEDRLSDRTSVHMRLFILDEIMQMPDYKQRLEEQTVNQYREDMKQLRLPHHVSMEDFLEVALQLPDTTNINRHGERVWRTDSDLKQKNKLSEFTACSRKGRLDGLVFSMEWLLEGPDDAITENACFLNCALEAKIEFSYKGRVTEIPTTELRVRRQVNAPRKWPNHGVPQEESMRQDSLGSTSPGGEADQGATGVDSLMSPRPECIYSRCTDVRGELSSSSL
ncbi:uncharacterized protein LOC128240420 isoform X2 [Mya arenaria]|uniref:uncharacterized protein LOC128240420 isoform X2 n=1 Tax=Mya arenaria TaxID=6604 RepID=UPI0022E97F9D|nr:uncharacterized protein LOC128240420 isoform X2 [Mya arenaria]